MVKLCDFLKNDDITRYLYLTCCELTANQLRQLVDALKVHKKIGIVNLNGNKLGDDALIILSDLLSSETDLYHLEMCGFDYTVKAFRNFAEYCKMNLLLNYINWEQGNGLEATAVNFSIFNFKNKI
jgi:hypothetical protein